MFDQELKAMETAKVFLKDARDNIIENSRGLIWGNNAAWLCVECDQLLGNRTADTEYIVTCSCGARYEILRKPSKSGSLHLGAATGVKRC